MSGVWLLPLPARQKIDDFFKSGADDFALIRAFFLSAFILSEAGRPQLWQLLRVI